VPESRVLLVEDEPLLREMMAEVLTDAGYEVTATCTGDEAAILIADGQGVDVLLTDVSMPGQIDGLGLAALAREVRPGLPVVLISGRPENEVAANRLGGPMAFLSKPYRLEALLDAVGRVMGQPG
jgi:CheY-like chemotaxis protein